MLMCLVLGSTGVACVCLVVCVLFRVVFCRLCHACCTCDGVWDDTTVQVVSRCMSVGWKRVMCVAWSRWSWLELKLTYPGSGVCVGVVAVTLV